jgi:hypothetical protein
VTERVEEKIADRLVGEANVRAALDASGVSYSGESMADGTRWLAKLGGPLGAMRHE